MRTLTRLVVMVVLLLLVAARLCAADPALNITGTDVYHRLKSRIDQIRLIDTHEHLLDEAARLKEPADCLATMLHYLDGDLISAGVPRTEGPPRRSRVQDTTIPFAERWAMFMNFWPEVRFTGCGRVFERAVRDLYGISLSEPDAQTGEQLNKAIAAALKPGFYSRVLKEKARIDVAIQDVSWRDGTRPDPALFAHVVRFDDFARLRTRAQLAELEKRKGATITKLEDLVKALEAAFEKGVKDGMVGVKSAQAYSRRIYYPETTEKEAQAALAALRSDAKPTEEAVLPLANYMMHQVCRLAGEHRLPLQIHTGLQVGVGKDITHSKPTDLLNLIQAFPETRFVMFHGAYPYGAELSAMAKNNPNVYIDMCWMYVVSPRVSRDCLHEWLETVPANKIMAFGGDYQYVEGVYAHAEIARENVAWVLAEKVLAGELTEPDALVLARKLLRDNALALFRLNLK